MEHGMVIVVINGDVNTRRDPITHRLIPSSEKHGDTRTNRLKILATFLSSLLRHSNLHIVFNMGNHEVMDRYPHHMSYFFRKMTNYGGDRFHVISNFKARIPLEMEKHEPQDGFKRFVKPYVHINGFGFVGYCTKDIFPWGKPQDQRCYSYALGNFFANDEKHRYINRFFKSCKRNMAQPETKVIFAVAHAGAKEFNQLELAKFLDGASKPIVAIFGHDHRQDHARGTIKHGIIGVQPYPYGEDVAIIRFKKFILTSIEYANTYF
jgi:hypothetical protein